MDHSDSERGNPLPLHGLLFPISRHVIYVPSVKDQNELYLDIWLFNNSHLCQFIEIVHNIMIWYMIWG